MCPQLPCRSAICLVCHRWRQLLLGEPAAWCSLRIRGGPQAPELRKQWAAATRALLQRHGGGLRSLFVSGCAALEAGGQPPAGPAVGAGPQVAAVQQPVPTSLSDLLAPLPPGQLTRLSLEWGPLLPPDALQPLSHLTCLECLVSVHAGGSRFLWEPVRPSLWEASCTASRHGAARRPLNGIACMAVPRSPST